MSDRWQTLKLHSSDLTVDQWYHRLFENKGGNATGKCYIVHPGIFGCQREF